MDRHIEPQILVDISGEFPCIDPRYVTKPYNKIVLAMTNKTHSREEAVVGGSYNSLAVCDVTTGKYRYWCAGEDVAVNEAAFVPRSSHGKLNILVPSSAL
jgi:carotenoid cleavage dioxygenase